VHCLGDGPAKGNDGCRDRFCNRAGVSP
jgi:hypothetical protein